MRRAPQNTPTYEGRALPRPDEEVMDQGLSFDMQTMLGRRQMLRAVGLGAVAVGLAACGAGTTTASATGSTSASTSGSTTGSTAGSTAASPSSSAAGSASSSTTAAATLTEIPDETAGPYPGDGSNGPDVLSQSGIVRSDIRSSFAGSTGVAEGVPMTLTLSIKDMVNGNAPFAGVAVYVWHCDREGRYSLYSDGVTEENYLRGVQVAGADGTVSFTSIYPATYSGRWPHIHFEVYPDVASITDSTNAIATSQVAMPSDVSDLVYQQPGYEQSIINKAQISLTSDNVFGDDGGIHELGTATGDVASGYHVTLDVPVDTSTAPTAGSAPAGGPGGGQGGGQPPSR